jgi:transcriptional regulator with XRE-family HTH domain
MKKSKNPSWGTRISNILGATGLTAHSLASLFNVDVRTTMRWLSNKPPDNANIAILIAIEHAIKEQKDIGPLRRKLHLLSACGGTAFLMFQVLKDSSKLSDDDFTEYFALRSNSNKGMT